METGQGCRGRGGHHQQPGRGSLLLSQERLSGLGERWLEQGLVCVLEEPDASFVEQQDPCPPGTWRGVFGQRGEQCAGSLVAEPAPAGEHGEPTVERRALLRGGERL